MSDINIKTVQALSQGMKVVTVEDIRWKRCDIKTTALMGHVLLNYQAQLAGADEAIILREGYLCEGSKTNVFIVKDGTVFTPGKNHNILGGITRDYVIEIVQHCDIPFEEKQIREAELLNADEIWITSTTSEVSPVIEIDGQTVGTGEAGPLWYQVANAYKENLLSE